MRELLNKHKFLYWNISKEMSKKRDSVTKKKTLIASLVCITKIAFQLFHYSKSHKSISLMQMLQKSQNHNIKQNYRKQKRKLKFLTKFSKMKKLWLAREKKIISAIRLGLRNIYQTHSSSFHPKVIKTSYRNIHKLHIGQMGQAQNSPKKFSTHKLISFFLRMS